MNINENEINISQGANQIVTPHASVLYSRFQPSNQRPWIISALIKTRLAKNDGQAQKILLVLVIIAIVIAVGFFIFAFKTEPIVI